MGSGPLLNVAVCDKSVTQSKVGIVTSQQPLTAIGRPSNSLYNFGSFSPSSPKWQWLLTAFFHCLSVKGRRHRGRRRECGHLRADAAAVSAIASGSQQSTMSVISHLIARSLSVSAPTNSATYLIGAASVEPFASRLVLPIRGARPWPPHFTLGTRPPESPGSHAGAFVSSSFQARL